MNTGLFEYEELHIVNKFLDKVDVLINIGANTGYYCCLALKKGKYVVAFEPIYENLRFLYNNLYKNNWIENLEIFPIALTNKVGISKIYGSGVIASLINNWYEFPEEYYQLIPVSTLDTILGHRFYGKIY